MSKGEVKLRVEQVETRILPQKQPDFEVLVTCNLATMNGGKCPIDHPSCLSCEDRNPIVEKFKVKMK